MTLSPFTYPVQTAIGQLPEIWPELARLKPRHAKDIASSTWSIGGETLDRDFADYQSYKKYLGPLGAKSIRLQGGWFKCEKTKGQYDFAWLDEIVNDAAAQGVPPWIELAYGNPIYEGGGEAKLGGALPTSPEALTAWDHWVRAMVTRYKGKVTHWEIWNEPDHGKDITGETYAAFYIRTARLIRSLQPEAKLLAVALADMKKLAFVQAYYEVLKQEQACALVDFFVYHGYSAAYGYAYNPDDVYPQVEILRKLVWSYDPSVIFFQGESGAPSTPNPTAGVFMDYAWSEFSQSKWDLRRMLGDHGRGISTSLFSISDMHYDWGTTDVKVNTKGVLKTNPDRTIGRPKLAYRAAQHVFSLFDDHIKLDATVVPTSDRINQSHFGYRHTDSDFSLISLWQREYPPYNEYEARLSTIAIEGGHFDTPVLVDLITGSIYAIPSTHGAKTGSQWIFSDIPVPDYPVVLTDKSVVCQ